MRAASRPRHATRRGHAASAEVRPLDARKRVRRRSVAVPSSSDLVGQVVGGFAIERLLAEGGMGAVYAARVVVSGQEVALKVLLPRHGGDVGLVSRFEREIQYASRIDHPNVVAVLARGWLLDGRPYYVMELHEGVTLGALVHHTGPIALERALEIADQLLDGLAAMHAAGIVHRDLQPDNVFLCRTASGEEQVKILDLGFAHEPGVDTGDGVTPDSPGALVGTLRFLSPEQATRGRAITERSDLFATALLIYYALTGKLPFRGRDDLAVVVAIVRAAPVPARKERRDVPRALDEVFARALAKHPDARYPDAASMRAALAAIPR
jgi:eukaryotic-like serine/threonine-protein kinase